MTIRIADIQRATAEHFGISLSRLLCQRRSAELVRARQISVYLAWELTDLTSAQIGKQFGDRDHTTILYTAKRIAALLNGGPAVYPNRRHESAEIKYAIDSIMTSLGVCKQ